MPIEVRASTVCATSFSDSTRGVLASPA